MNALSHPKFVRRSISILALAACLAAIISSCSSLAPHRTLINDQLNCAPINPHVDPLADDSFGLTRDPACARLIREISPGVAQESSPYSLHFAEFDDQGLLYPTSADNGFADQQMEQFLDYVRATAQKRDERGEERRLAVIVFVHGWKHDARGDDSNVRWFRALLAKFADVETHSTCPRKIVGLYAGWHGNATALPDIAANLTFWARKSAAEQIAEGQIRELFGRLRSIQNIDNADWNGDVERTWRTASSTTAVHDPGCRKKMRLLVIGHSFGGLIVYNALSQSLIRDISDLHERILHAESAASREGAVPALRRDPMLEREGDLIVAINPANQAARYVPLWRAARSARPRSYHAPLFVSITSGDDWATRYAFPAARFFSTLSNHYPSASNGERNATLYTMGQDQEYVDYTLNTLANLNEDPAYAQIGADADCESLRYAADFSKRYNLEIDRLDKLARALTVRPDANCLTRFPPAACNSTNADTESAEPLFPRRFCIAPLADRNGSTRDADVAIALRPHKEVNLNSPIWNVYTSKPVLNDHSDLLNPILIDFLRQLYEEGTRSELQRVP